MSAAASYHSCGTALRKLRNVISSLNRSALLSVRLDMPTWFLSDSFRALVGRKGAIDCVFRPNELFYLGVNLYPPLFLLWYIPAPGKSLRGVV